MILKLLASPIFFGLCIPILFLLASALAKKLVRGSGGWERSDFFLGIEAALAAMSSGLVNIFDIVRQSTVTGRVVDVSRLLATGGFLAINFFLLLYLLSIHQDWQAPSANAKGQFVWLGLISNVIGFALLWSSIVIIKGLS